MNSAKTPYSHVYKGRYDWGLWCRDLAKVLVLSDIHGNSDALTSVLNSPGGWDYIWVLGDLVDYGPEPHVVVDVIRELRPDIHNHGQPRLCRSI